MKELLARLQKWWSARSGVTRAWARAKHFFVIICLLTAALTAVAQTTNVTPVDASPGGIAGTTTVAPNADGTTTNWSKGGTCTAGNFYTCVNDYADAGGASYIETTSNAQSSVNFTLDLADMPSDFRSATNVKIDAYAMHDNASPSGGVDTQKLGVDIISSSTLITNQPADQTLATSMANYSFSLQPLIWNDKTTWDAAKLRVYGKWTTVGSTDGTTKALVASTQVTITYLTNTGNITQQKYIFENDDGGGSADNATQMAAANTAITSVKKGERINARFQVSNTGATSASDYALFYDRNDGGYWSRVMSSAPIPTVVGSNCDGDSKFVCGQVDTAPTTYTWEHGLAIDNFGRPWISYWDDGSNKDLKVANYVGIGGNCGTSNSWSCQTIETTNNNGQGTQIAVDSDNTVWVTSYDDTGTKIYIAHNRPGEGTGTCTGGPAGWSCDAITVAVNHSGTVGMRIPIAIGPSGKPAIAFVQNGTNQIKMAQYVGSGGSGCTGSGAWSGCGTIQTDGNNNSQIDLAFASDGKPWITYINTSNGRLSVATYKSLAGGGSCTNDVNWDCTDIDKTASATHNYVDLEFGGDGSAWISYGQTPSSGKRIQKLAKYVGSGGGSAAGCGTSSPTTWACYTMDATASTDEGDYGAMAIAPDGNPWITYYDGTNADLRVSRWVPTGGGGSSGGCGTGSNANAFCNTIQSAGGSDVGNWPQIAFANDGTAWLTWGNDTGYDIEFARLNRGGELLTTPGLSGTSNGATISESHGDMSSATDTANRDDADCVSGTWVNGKWFESDRGTGVSLASGQCTEISFSIDTSQATAGTTYRLMLATADAFDSSVDMWRGATVASNAYATITIESPTTTRYSKDSLATSATDCTSSSWSCTAVDVTGTVGAQSSMAVTPDGTPWIAYNDTTNGALKVAKYVGQGNGGSTCPGGSNAWACSTIEQSSGHTYGSTQVSLAIDGSGAPWISYYDGNASYKDLYVAHYVGSGGSGCTGAAASAWTCMQIAATGDVGSYNSIAIDSSGRPWISYYEYINASTGKLWVAHLGSDTSTAATYNVGTTCSGTSGPKWTCLAVTTANDQGRYNAIALDSNSNPWIAYRNDTAGTLLVARYGGLNGSSCGTNVTSWTCSQIDNTGYDASIAFDSAQQSAWVSYYTSGNILKIAHYVATAGTGCTGTSAWSCGQVDTNTPSSGDNGTSIAIDSVGRPWISYKDSTSNKVKVARYVASGGACGTGNFLNMFTCTDVSPTSGTYGSGSGIAFDASGVPWVSTSRIDNSDLSVAKLKLPAGQPGYTVKTAPSSGRNAQTGDLRYTFDYGKSPRTEGAGVCSSNTDAKGYCAAGTNDSIYDAMSANAYETPTYVFATRTASAASYPSYSWRGQSNIATWTSNVKIEVYRFGSTNDWITLTTNSYAGANVDFTLTGTASAGSTTDYWEADGANYWTYFRVTQAASASATTLKTTYFGSVISNAVPSSAGAGSQFKLDASTSITTGGVTAESGVVLKSALTDGDSGDTLYLCAEVKPNATSFDGTGETCGTTGVATTATASVTISGLVNDSYHWRVRTRDAQGNYSASYTQFNSGNLAFTVTLNQLPNTPTATLAQTKANHSTAIATNGYTNETQVWLDATVSDPDAGDTVALCAEVAAALTSPASPGTCGSLATNNTTGSVNVTGLTSGTTYKWQVKSKDNSGLYSTSYAQFNSGNAAFTVDTVAPSAGTINDGSSGGTDATYNAGSLDTLACNWSAFSDAISGISSYDVSIGTTPGATDVSNGVSGATSGWFVGVGTFNSGWYSYTTGSVLSLHTSQTYYCNVRATDGAGNTATASSNGQLVAPTLTFNVSTSNVAFDPLNNTNSYTDTKSITLTTSTNAYNGYEIHQYMNGLMTNGTNTIPAFNGGSYASPDSWQSGDIGLGYTSSDSSVAGANKFQAATCPGGSAIAAPGCYAPFTLSSPGAIVADHTAAVTATPITNETFTITFRLTTSATQPAGNYLGTITYSAIASF